MNYRITQDKFLALDERRLLLATLGEWFNEGKYGRDAAMILVLLFTGCRAQELLNIQWEDVNPGEGSIYIRGLKGSNDRRVTVPTWVMKRLVENVQPIYMLRNPDKTPIGPPLRHVFGISYERLSQIFKKLGLRKSIKSLRHTFAMELYEKTQDLFLVKMALGHRSISSTLVYVDYIDSETRLKKLKTLGLYGLPCE